MAAHDAAAPAGMAAARPARSVVLRHAGAVLAMTSAFDASVPNMARIYNYWLGGKDHFAADRAEADRLVGSTRRCPRWSGRTGRSSSRRPAGRPAGDRAVHRPGRRASGAPWVHQAARAVLPAARVAYVDIDPVVLSHAVALLATGDGVAAVDADLRDPAAVLGNQDLRAVINPGRPVCVILGAVVHFLDPQAACAVTAGYVSLMAPGSCLVLSCARFEDEQLAKQLAEEYTAATWYNHSPAGIDGVLRRAGTGRARRDRGTDLAEAAASGGRPYRARARRRGPRPRHVITTAHEDCRCLMTGCTTSAR